MTDARYGNRKVTNMIADWRKLAEACRAEGTPSIQEALDRVEQFIDASFQFTSQYDEMVTKAADNFVSQLLGAAMQPMIEEIKQGRAKRYMHRRTGGTYYEVGRGAVQTSDRILMSDMSPVVVYRSEKDLSLWVRPVSEFEDGRFMKI